MQCCSWYLKLWRLTGVSVCPQVAQQPLQATTNICHTQSLHLCCQLLLQESSEVTRFQQVLHRFFIPLLFFSTF